MEDFWPDPVDRTEVFFRGIHHAVEMYWADFENLPQNVSQLHDSLEFQAAIDVDAWGSDIVYRRLERSYCLWSAGPDTEFETGDDLAEIAEIRGGKVVSVRLEPGGVAARCRG